MRFCGEEHDSVDLNTLSQSPRVRNELTALPPPLSPLTASAMLGQQRQMLDLKPLPPPPREMFEETAEKDYPR